MADSDKETTPVHYDKNYQEGTSIPFLDHDFVGYHTIEWNQWEINVQLLGKGALQLNSANNIGTKVNVLVVKLYAANGKETIMPFKVDT
eukprot:657522-Ditylum_brightwellii.AAC.1